MADILFNALLTLHCHASHAVLFSNVFVREIRFVLFGGQPGVALKMTSLKTYRRKSKFNVENRRMQNLSFSYVFLRLQLTLFAIRFINIFTEFEVQL